MRRESQANRLAKECMVTALVALMKEKRYENISVSDIARRAGVSRMAYYRNYTSKDDILNKYMEEVGRAIHKTLSEQNSAGHSFEYFRCLFEELGQHHEIGVAALRANRSDLIMANIEKYMFETFPTEPGDAIAAYRVRMAAGGFYCVFMEWLKNGRQESPEALAGVCCEMLHIERIENRQKGGAAS